jgi:hypothetical protein
VPALAGVAAVLGVLGGVLGSCDSRGARAPREGGAPGVTAGAAAAETVSPPLAAGGDSLSAAQVEAALVADRFGATSQGGRVFCAYVVLGREGEKAYLSALCEELVPAGDSLEAESGAAGPVLLTLDTLAAPPRIASVRVPRDGADFARDIQALFPPAIIARIRVPAPVEEARVFRLQEEVRRAAAAHYAGRR